MENVDETKLQGDHPAESGMESVIGEEPFEEPAPIEIASEESGKDDLVDADTALNALVGEVGRSVDRVESRLTAKGQMAGIMLALATTILAILSGLGIHGAAQYLVVIMEAFTVFLGVVVIFLVLSSSSVSGVFDAISKYNSGRYDLMMESIINSGMTLMNNNSRRNFVAAVAMLLQLFTGTAGFAVLLVGSI